MTEAILLALWMGTILFFGIREYKERKKRESHEYYLSELRYCLHSIEHEFQESCQEIIINAFSGRNVRGEIVVDKYWEEIIALKKEYSDHLYEKVDERMKRKVSTLPNHFVEDYERNVSEIADTFRNIGDFMLEQIKDITKGDYHWRMNFLE